MKRGRCFIAAACFDILTKTAVQGILCDYIFNNFKKTGLLIMDFKTKLSGDIIKSMLSKSSYNYRWQICTKIIIAILSALPTIVSLHWMWLRTNSL